MSVDRKAVRACDSCIRKRARWYCASDDAFLCQSCDASVHSANSLSRKHERVRLKVSKCVDDEDDLVPSWLVGFTRKARSPRKPPGHVKEPGPGLSVVPELGETSQEENEDEQLLYRVPVYDLFDSEVRNSDNAKEPDVPTNAAYDAESKEVKALLAGFGADEVDGILPSEADLAEFAADVESLLGGECHEMDGLGMTCHSTLEVKLESNDANADVAFGESDVAVGGEGFEVNFDHDSPAEEKRKILLNLDYESVMSAWESQQSPWTTGCRPEIRSSEECWPEMGGDRNVYDGVMSRRGVGGDGGREARVTRYREKRRTRLFSKKIRYEVRKLNAEKRPRIKGRFVKRGSLL